jgi:hypothetical protein
MLHDIPYNTLVSCCNNCFSKIVSHNKNYEVKKIKKRLPRKKTFITKEERRYLKINSKHFYVLLDWNYNVFVFENNFLLSKQSPCLNNRRLLKKKIRKYIWRTLDGFQAISVFQLQDFYSIKENIESEIYPFPILMKSLKIGTKNYKIAIGIKSCIPQEIKNSVSFYSSDVMSYKKELAV